MRVEEITSLDGLLALQKEWTELLEQSNVRVIFLTPEWIITWWRLFGQDDAISGPKTLWTLAVRDGARLVGLVPFMIRTRRRFGCTLRLLEFVGGGFGDYSDFIVGSDKEQILTALWGHIAKCTVWDIGVLNDFSVFADHVLLSEQCLSAENLSFKAQSGNVCPYVRIDAPWDVFYEKAHGGPRRRKLGQLERKLARKGTISYGLVHGHRADPQLIETMAAVQCARDRPENLFDDHSKRRFLERFVLDIADKDWIRVSTLKLDGQWVAYFFGFYYANRYSIYNISFVQEMAQYSPCSLLMIQVLKRAFEEGLEEVDFLRGATEFKLDWTKESRCNTRLVFYRNNAIGRLTHSLYMSLLPRLKGLSVN